MPRRQEASRKREITGVQERCVCVSHFYDGVSSEALVQTGSPAVELFIAALKDADKNVRYTAAKALGEIGDARAIDPLVMALKDADYYVRVKAVEALVKIGDVAVEPLIAALNDSDTDVREAAEGTISHIGTPKAKRAVEEYQRQRPGHVTEHH